LLTDQMLRSSWVLTTTGGPSKVDRDFSPLAEAWHDIDLRERAAGISAGQPVLMSAKLVDYRIGDYFRCAFGTDRSTTALTYAKELRIWLPFLETRGANWDDATPADVRAFQIWRVYDERNPATVSPATWNKGWAALRHFYGWSERTGWVRQNPVGEQDRLRNSNSPGGYREKNARSSRDRWITPSEYRLWRDVGLRGYQVKKDSSGAILADVPDDSSRARNISRNLAFVDYLVTTGLRLEEAGTLLVPELPSSVGQEAPIVGKGGVRRHYRVMNDMGMISLHQYMNGERKDVIRRAQKAGIFERLSDRIEVVELIQSRSHQKVRIANGRVLVLERLTRRERENLFLQRNGGLEPAWLWLTEHGTPLKPPSWDKVFDTANDRVTDARDRLGVASPRVTVTPHSLRFSFALFVALAAIRAIDDRLGNDASAPFLVRNYAQAFDEVRDLLGHSSVEITKNYYLEPLKGLRRSLLLRGGSLEAMWDSIVSSGTSVGFGS
jgi:site-specific recombinase XerD